jgi:hypothetical protein
MMHIAGPRLDIPKHHWLAKTRMLLDPEKETGPPSRKEGWSVDGSRAMSEMEGVSH